MRAVVVANGELPSPGLAAEVCRGVDLVVAADGGYSKARSLGLTPDAVVGDLDSIGGDGRPSLGRTAVVHRPSPYETDLEKAVAYTLEQGATEIAILAAGGGRYDHAIANLSVLRRFRGAAHIELLDDRFAVSLVDGETEFVAEAGTVVSLVAIGPCEGVRTRGLRWDLEGVTLEFGTLGVHNVVDHSPASVAVASGDLLLFRGRWVEDHT